MTAAQHSAETVLWPRLSKLMRDYPDITVELVTDEGLTDIVSERFCGRRSSVRRMTSSLARCRSVPKTSLAIAALTCGVSRAEDTSPGSSKSAAAKGLNQRARRGPACGQQPGTRTERRTRGVWASLPAGGLRRRADHEKSPCAVLEDWCEPFPGYHLYSPSSRQHAPIFAVVFEALLTNRSNSKPAKAVS